MAITPRRFTRPDGSIVEVMQWNPVSIPEVVKWVVEHQAISHVIVDPEDDEKRLLVIARPAGGDAYHLPCVVHEDELLVRIRRPSGDDWESVDVETWATYVQYPPREEEPADG